VIDFRIRQWGFLDCDELALLEARKLSGLVYRITLSIIEGRNETFVPIRPAPTEVRDVNIPS
jgi:hypothetical protein